MKRIRCLSLLLSLVLLFMSPATVFAESDTQVCPTYNEAYERLTALRDSYPEGMTWTNDTPYGDLGHLGANYIWKGGVIEGIDRGRGCWAYGAIGSDSIFDRLPARLIRAGDFTFDDVKIGDILSVKDGTHFVIVWQKSAGGVIVTEGNYNKSVHWGRVMTEAEVMADAVFVLTRYPANYVPADDPEANIIVQSGAEGSLAWSLTKAGTLTISGNGPIPDYSPNDDNLPSWNAYNNSINTIVIEDGVTRIGNYAFYQSDALSVYLPDSVQSIGQSAFYGSDLIAVTVPSNTKTISNDAFRYCPNLASVTFPEGVQTIGERTFYGCTSLEYADFPSSIISVGSGAFMSCENLTRVRFVPGENTPVLGDNLFSQCWNLTDVTLPQGIKRITAGMFASCSSLSELYIPQSVNEIGENPFTSCRALRVIEFGGSESAWNAMAGPYLKASLQSTKTSVSYNVEFENPFEPDPEDSRVIIPLKPDENAPTDPDDSGDENSGDQTPTVPETPTDPEPTHTHFWSSDWQKDTSHHWHECSVEGCDVSNNSDKSGYAAHNYSEWVTDKSPTANQTGSKHRLCIVCGYRQTETIPATGETPTQPNDPGNSGGGGDSSDKTPEKPSTDPGNSVNKPTNPPSGSEQTGSTTKKPSKKVVKVKKLKIVGAPKKLKVGKTVTLKVKVTPTNATNKKVTWKSSNKKYATVNSKGKVKAKKAGKGKTVKITATTKDGSKKKVTVKIKIK